MTGILFDLDGTLLDTLDDLTDSVNHALEVYGHPPRTREEIRRFVGNGAERLIRLSVPEGAAWEGVYEEYQTWYRSHSKIKTAPYAGIPEALKVLAEKYPVAIVSNKPDPATKSLCAEFFPGIPARGERADCPRKPAPESIWQAMKAIGADHCIYVGDSEVDVLTAKNAGCPCLSVLWGFRDADVIRNAGGTCLCSDPAQLVQTAEMLIENSINRG